MKTAKQVREELSDIKYYHSRKKVLEAEFENVGLNKSKELAEVYSELVKKAPPRIFDMYVMLYVKGYTQEALGNLMCYARNYVYQLNKQLVEYFVNEFSKGENDNESNAWFY